MKARDGASIGAMIGAVGGVLFVVLNAGTFGTPWTSVVIVLGILAFVLVAWSVLRVPADPDVVPPDARQLQAFWITVGLEFVAIFAGAQVFIRVVDKPGASLPWVAVVLGVHWLVFHMVFRKEVFVWLGWLTLACGVTGLMVALTDVGEVWTVPLVSGVLTGVVMLGCVGVDASKRRAALLRRR